jgi:hypothetical protein
VQTREVDLGDEAEATGSGSNSMNIWSMLRPSPRSISAIASTDGNGGTSSWSRASSSATSAGSRSRRVDSTWPNFTKIGPSASRAIRRRAPRGASSRRPNRSARTMPSVQREPTVACAPLAAISSRPKRQAT